MPVRPILLFGDPRLKEAAIPVDPAADHWRRDAADLLDTLMDLRGRLGFGRALAGPQIGSPFRLIAFDCSLGRFVAVNPEISWRSKEMVPVWDDCFSLPGVCMAVMRHRSVSLRWLRLDGSPAEFEKIDPSFAELVQHEVDHLDGILMNDRLTDPTGIIARENAGSAAHPGV